MRRGTVRHWIAAALCAALTLAHAGPAEAAGTGCDRTADVRRPQVPASGCTPAKAGPVRRDVTRDHSVPLPRPTAAPADAEDGIALGDGVNLTGRVGARDGLVDPTLDGVTTKRTAVVPRRIGASPSTVFRHGAGDGVGVGLSIGFGSP